MFLSDNGPFLSYGNHAGSAGPLREGKLTTFEGGVRVPFIARWPGKVPAGPRRATSSSPALDLLPDDRQARRARSCRSAKIDGEDLSPLLLGEHGATGATAFSYYSGRRAARGAGGRVEAAPAARVPDGGRPAGQGRQAGQLRASMKPEAIERVGHPRHRQPARLPGREDRAVAVRPDGRPRRDEGRGGRAPGRGEATRRRWPTSSAATWATR